MPRGPQGQRRPADVFGCAQVMPLWVGPKTEDLRDLSDWWGKGDA